MSKNISVDSDGVRWIRCDDCVWVTKDDGSGELKLELHRRASHRVMEGSPLTFSAQRHLDVTLSDDACRFLDQVWVDKARSNKPFMDAISLVLSEFSYPDAFLDEESVWRLSESYADELLAQGASVDDALAYSASKLRSLFAAGSI